MCGVWVQEEEMERVRKVLSKWSTAQLVQCLGVFDMERGKDTKVCVPWGG